MNYFLDQEFIEGFRKPLFGKMRHFIDLISIGIMAEDGRKYYAICKEFDLKKAWANKWLRENVLSKIHSELVEKEHYCRQHHPDLIVPFNHRSMKHLIAWNGKTRKRIAKEIVEFINPHLTFNPTLDINLFGSYMKMGDYLKKHDVRDVSDGLDITFKSQFAHPVFYGYFADYDWVLFCSLFGKMIELPKGFPYYCRDLKQMFDEKCERYENQPLRPIIFTREEFADLKNRPTREFSSYIKKYVKSYPVKVDEHNALADAIWNKELFEYMKYM